MFLNLSDTRVVVFSGNENTSRLYWFITEFAVAKSHADYWRDNSGTDWRLTLKCTIPHKISHVDNIHNFHSIAAHDINRTIFVFYKLCFEEKYDDVIFQMIFSAKFAKHLYT